MLRPGSRRRQLCLSCLACLLAVAAASGYTVEQKYEVFDDILHEALPSLSVDWNCLVNAGTSSASCALNGLLGCGLGSSDVASIVRCLVNKCGGSLSQMLTCVSL